MNTQATKSGWQSKQLTLKFILWWLTGQCRDQLTLDDLVQGLEKMADVGDYTRL